MDGSEAVLAEEVAPEREVLGIFTNLQKVFESEQDKREVSSAIPKILSEDHFDNTYRLVQWCLGLEF